MERNGRKNKYFKNMSKEKKRSYENKKNKNKNITESKTFSKSKTVLLRKTFDSDAITLVSSDKIISDY